MRRTAPLLLLALLALGTLPVRAELRPQSGGRTASILRVDVQRGRVHYVLPVGGDVRTLTARSRPLLCEAGAYLEFGIGTDVELAFSGGASVRLTGPGIVSWEASAPEAGEPGAPAPREELVLRLGRIERAEVESRGPRLVLEHLDAGWALELPEGALRLERRPNRDLRVLHHGGLPVRVRSRVARAPGSWPVRLRAGDRVTLPAPR